jgi:(p)ppGpp synthase/HD superfamily hydrolase
MSLLKNDEVIRAIAFATKAHEGQFRRYTNEKYINHPIEVATLVSTVPHTKAMLQAAALHDVAEDTSVTLDEIESEFGVEVRILVEGLTDVSKPSDGNRIARKTIDLHHTASASPETKTIKLADLISNSKSIIEHDPNFARVYLSEKAKLMEVLKEGDSTLYAQAIALLYEGWKILNPVGV